MSFLIPWAAAAGAGAAKGYFDRPKETKTQKQQRKLIDEMMRSLNGGGKYSDLYEVDEDAFQKSFVEPAKARFANQTAPAIQQEYIYSGQQRGSGLDDTLTRAGVDMDSMLNEHYAKFRENALNRKQNAMNSIIGANQGVNQQGGWSAAGQGAASGFADYAGQPAFGQDIQDLLKWFKGKPQANEGTGTPEINGFSG